jgi:hypothetical protein
VRIANFCETKKEEKTPPLYFLLNPFEPHGVLPLKVTKEKMAETRTFRTSSGRRWCAGGRVAQHSTFLEAQANRWRSSASSSRSARIGETDSLTVGSEGRSLSLLSTLKRLFDSPDRRPLNLSSFGGVGGGPPPQLGLPSRSSKAPSTLGGVGGGTSPILSGGMFALPTIGIAFGKDLRWRLKFS